MYKNDLVKDFKLSENDVEKIIKEGLTLRKKNLEKKIKDMSEKIQELKNEINEIDKKI